MYYVTICIIGLKEVGLAKKKEIYPSLRPIRLHFTDTRFKRIDAVPYHELRRSLNVYYQQELS